MKALDRLMSGVIKTDDGCWDWQRANNGNGYGVIGYQKRQWYVHRLAYTLLVGDIPEGKQLDHLCRNRSCCNPEHLEPVDARTNLMRGDTVTAKKAAQTHCVNGHELVGQNVAIRTNGCRRCRVCHRERVKAAYRRDRALDKQTGGDV